MSDARCLQSSLGAKDARDALKGQLGITTDSLMWHLTVEPNIFRRQPSKLR